MKIIRVKIDNELDRKAIVFALASNRYKVWVSETAVFPADTDYWVCFEIKETGILEDNQ